MFAQLFNAESLIHSIKTVIACLLGFAVTKFIGSPADQWVVITILVVMCAQIYVGSIVQKAYLRFLGTLIGCVFASIMIYFFGSDHIIVAITLALASLIFSYLATLKENFTLLGTLGAVTTAIIMMGTHPTLYFALERFLEISFGILIAFLVSQFILPIHARSHLKRAQIYTLELLRDYFKLTIQKSTELIELDYHDLDEQIVKTLLKQRQLAKESATERWGTSFDKFQFTESLFFEREILRATTFMQNALRQLKKEETIFIYSAPTQEFNEKIVSALNVLINNMKDGNFTQAIELPTLAILHNELRVLITEPSDETFMLSNAFMFAADVIMKSIASLATLHGIKINK